MIDRDDPLVIAGRDLPPPGTTGPAAAPPVPDTDDLPEGIALKRMTKFAARPRSRLGGWAWTLASGLVSLVIAVAAYDFVIGLFARSPALGSLALALFGLLGLVLLGLIGRELLAMRRLARMDAFHTEAAAVLASADIVTARALADRLDRFYASRDGLAWARERLAETRHDLVDADAVIEATERLLLAGLDAEARREIESAARVVAAATALVPLALIDVMAALVANLRMIRRLAEIYGGRAGVVGSWRLLRMVATHLLATGAVAAGDDLIHSVAGGGLLARVSRRFGEGVVNGALTARIGIAAMEVCRPLPFRVLPRPKVSNVLSRAVTSLMQKPD